MELTPNGKVGNTVRPTVTLKMVLTASIFSTNIALFFGLLYPLIQANRVPLIVMYCLTTAMTLVFCFMTMYRDPAKPLESIRANWRTKSQHQMGAFCRTCKLEIFSLSCHCRECNRCVEQWDHHCLWLNRCIGKRNIFWFLLLLWSYTAHLILYLTSSMLVMVRKTTDKSLIGQVVIVYAGFAAYLTILILVVILLVISYRKRCSRNKVASAEINKQPQQLSAIQMDTKIIEKPTEDSDSEFKMKKSAGKASEIKIQASV